MADSDFEAAAAELRKALDERLDAYLGRIGEVVFRAVTDVLHSAEFAGWQSETRAAAKLAAQVAKDAAWVREHNGEDAFRAVTDVLHSAEFAGWQSETRAAAAKILGNAAAQ